MSRFGDASDYDERSVPEEFFYQALSRHTNGPRGQHALRQVLKALDAMPRRRLGYNYVSYDGEVCLVGAYAAYKEMQRGLTWEEAVEELPQGDADYETIALGRQYGLAKSLATEMAWQNDEMWGHLTDEERWRRARDWVRSLIIPQAGEEFPEQPPLPGV